MQIVATSNWSCNKLSVKPREKAQPRGTKEDQLGDRGKLAPGDFSSD